MLKLVLATLLPNQMKARTGLFIVKVLNEKCTRQEKMLESLLSSFFVDSIILCKISILHANPLCTKSEMSVVRDRLSSRTSTQCKVSELLIFSVAENFGSLQ